MCPIDCPDTNSIVRKLTMEQLLLLVVGHISQRQSGDGSSTRAAAHRRSGAESAARAMEPPSRALRAVCSGDVAVERCRRFGSTHTHSHTHTHTRRAPKSASGEFASSAALGRPPTTTGPPPACASVRLPGWLAGSPPALCCGRARLPQPRRRHCAPCAPAAGTAPLTCAQSEPVLCAQVPPARWPIARRCVRARTTVR